MNLKIITYFFIIPLFGLILNCCQDSKINFEQPDCGVSFSPYQWHSNLYHIVEDGNRFWHRKQYYAICPEYFVIKPFEFDAYTEIVFSHNSIQQKSYLRIGEHTAESEDFPDYYNLLYDTILLLHHTIFGRPQFINLYSTEFEINEPIILRMLFQPSEYSSRLSDYNVSIYDARIYKVDAENKRILNEVPGSVSEIYDIFGFRSLSGLVSAPLSEMGSYIAGVPLSKAYQPTEEGGIITALEKTATQENKIIYQSSYYGGAFFKKYQQEAFTRIFIFYKEGTTLKGQAIIEFNGQKAGEYSLGDNCFAKFIYIVNNKLRYFNTTGMQGKIIIDRYEAVGGRISGTIEMNDESGGINQDGTPVIITAGFDVYHCLPWNF